MADITAIILAKNEEANIQKCIRSIKGFVERIILVDSGSTDQTAAMAKELGVETYFHEWKHYADQFNWALDNIPISTKWVYRIDADEVVPPELAEEIEEETERHKDDSINGFIMKHKLFFLGRFLTHGGAYPFLKITIFKPEYGRFENRAMGEHVVLEEGTTLTLEHDCLHYDCKSLTAFVDKHNSYATREVIDYYERRNALKAQAELYGEAERTKKIRDGLYYRLPLFLRARLYYWYRYYIKLGFLDGTPGRIYAFLQAYWYRYLVDAKIYEAEKTDEG